MQLARRLPIPAIFCAVAVLVCELVSRPYAEMGVCDDWSYIRTAQELAATGHIVYNGWATAMLGWQLYLGAAFIKLFGFSFTTVRMSTLLVAVALAFFLQRTLVLADIDEGNAAIGTLALVLSPLYLMLSVTFMSDIQGLFAMVLCLYGCLRALHAARGRAMIGWLCFSVATNAICGSSRQIAWLGILVMVPCALWLLRAQRRVLFAGAAANLAGAIFVFACLRWLKQQPHTVPEHLFPSNFSVVHMLGQLSRTGLDVPFLLLPIVALFLLQICKRSRTSIMLIVTVSLAYTLLALQPSSTHHIFLLEPTLGDWVNVHGAVGDPILQGSLPIFLPTGVQLLLTIVSIASLLCVIATLLRSRKTPPVAKSSPRISWNRLGVLLGPCTIAYILLLFPRGGTSTIFDRYTLWLLVVTLLFLVRYYQERIQPKLPLSSVLLVAIVAVYSVVVIHNMFAFYRARAALAAEIRAAGVSDTSVDNGWEYNSWVELQYSDFVDDPTVVLPANADSPVSSIPAGTCRTMNSLLDNSPHIRPRYAVSFDPDACYGLAPFATVNYSRWLASRPGTLYVVNYSPPSKP